MTTTEVKVMLVDDNPDDISIIRRLLAQYEPARFSVSSTNSTQSCLPLLDANPTDLLFLDYSMPQENGVSFLRRTNGLVDLPPVIMITGQADHRLAVQAIRYGASDCISKNTLTSHLLGQAAQDALAKFHNENELSRHDENVLAALARTCAHLDPTTGGARLASIAEWLGRGLQLKQYQLELLRVGSLLHDVGKLGVREELIFKPGPLTADEYDEVKLHPLIGERMCAPLKLWRELGPIIRHHHERWDGAGYVDGLIGEEIPLLARIISVADAFDAMTADRPYRQGLPLDEALKRLELGGGSQWDPDIVNVFLRRIDWSFAA